MLIGLFVGVCICRPNESFASCSLVLVPNLSVIIGKSKQENSNIGLTSLPYFLMPIVIVRLSRVKESFLTLTPLK